jgi:UDP-glucose 4-epimerase
VDPLRVLVTGAGGFNGTHLVSALLDAGHTVVALVGRRQTGRFTAPWLPGLNLNVVFLNLADGISLEGKVDAVVHAAAVSPGPGAQPTAGDFFRNNVEGTRRLILWARGHGVRQFVYLSSVSVFGRIKGPVLDESSLRVDPDAYGISKWMGEEMLRDEHNGMLSLSLRLPGVIGRGAVRNWLASMALAAKEGREISYFHGGADYNNAVHVDDLCRFVVGMLDRGWKEHDVVTLAAEGTMKVRDMVRTIAEGLGGRSPLREVPAPRPPFTISISRAQTRYDYRPMAMPAMIARFVAENR